MTTRTDTGTEKDPGSPRAAPCNSTREIFSGHTAIAEVDLGAIVYNYEMLRQSRETAQGVEACPELGVATGIHLPAVMPVVKADAYGHGHIEVSETLCRAGAGGFASGSVQEACLLRQGLAEKQLFPEVVSLLGPVTAEDWQLVLRYSIIPVVHSLEQLALLPATGLRGAGDGLFPVDERRPLLPIVVKCNSGMARLGFGMKELPAFLQALAVHSRPFEAGNVRGLVPVMAISHLACADGPDGPEQMLTQAKTFSGMLELLRRQGPVAASLCNSAGTLLAEYADPVIGPQVCRPGIALYGHSPLEGTPHEEKGRALRPAMRVRTPIIALRELESGENIGYGHTWTAGQKTLVGIIAAGYADGFSRGLSNKGQVSVGGIRANILGRVSMQMTAVDLSLLAAKDNPPRVGEFVDIIGGEGDAVISADELARHWGTISYEALCLLGMNPRHYVNRPWDGMP